jgi:hypothetical protein
MVTMVTLSAKAVFNNELSPFFMAVNSVLIVLSIFFLSAADWPRQAVEKMIDKNRGGKCFIWMVFHQK